MPCDDVTELLRIEIDSRDRLRSYRFRKKTCGGAIGTESLLLPRLKDLSVADLLALQTESFFDNGRDRSEAERYLELKHFFAVRSALEALTGDAPGGVGSACAIAEIIFDGETMIVETEITVAIVAEKIKACGRCGCG